MLKTNSKQYQANFKKYILSVIDSEDLPSETMTDKEKIDFLPSTFSSDQHPSPVHVRLTSPGVSRSTLSGNRVVSDLNRPPVPR